MGFRRIIGIVLVVVGVLMVGFAFYVKAQVNAGSEKVRSAQKSVNQGSSFFSNTPPVVKGIVTRPIQKKIDAGKAEIAKYAAIAGRLQIAGVVCIVVGGVMVLVPKKRRR